MTKIKPRRFEVLVDGQWMPITIEEVHKGDKVRFYEHESNWSSEIVICITEAHPNDEGILCLCFENLSNFIRPPRGILPKYIWNEKRVDEIKRAFTDYMQVGKTIPVEWLAEYNELVGGLK